MAFERYRVQPLVEVLSAFNEGIQDEVLVYIHGDNTGLKRACRDAANLYHRRNEEAAGVLRAILSN